MLWPAAKVISDLVSYQGVKPPRFPRHLCLLISATSELSVAPSPNSSARYDKPVPIAPPLHLDISFLQSNHVHFSDFLITLVAMIHFAFDFLLSPCHVIFPHLGPLSKPRRELVQS
ncbi:hypothetical protein PM082_013771 [Marasmius tenuissimus]|nr:hypothetical protein PM082_013771 [Marasmius tenuissimus]